MLVVDASVVVDLLLEAPPNTALRERLATATDLHAPHLVDIEFLSVLRRLVGRGSLSVDAAGMARRTFAELPLERYPHTRLGNRIWELRGHLTAYDAAYVALAEALDVPLVTSGGRLARAGGHAARVESFAR